MKINRKILLFCSIIILSIVLVVGASYAKGKLVNNDNKSSVVNKESTTKRNNNNNNLTKKDEVVENNNNEIKAAEESNHISEENKSSNIESKNNEVNETENREIEKSDVINNDTKAEQVVEEEKITKSINIEVIDEASNSLTNKNFTMEFKEGESLNDVMIRFLPEKAENYKMVDGYLSKLYGLKEREQGPNSGWIFYVNGVKSSIGAKDVILNNGDSILWKYVKDGVYS